MQKVFIVSWSGGKDSALAYYRAVMAGHVPLALLTMFEEEGARSRSHGLRKEVLEAQAERMGVPLVTGQAGWQDYESEFRGKLESLRAQGADTAVYGDIDLEDHKIWEENVGESVGMATYHPLWMESRSELLAQLLEEEFEAVITAVDPSRMDEKFLGRTLTNELIEELESLGIDACGEEGEFHTVITDGPIFVERVPLVFGEIFDSGLYRMLDVKLQTEG